MAKRKPHVIVGVDTHKDTHHAAALDATGRILGDHQFPATSDGYRQLLDWIHQLGRPRQVGVEGTGSYGAGLTRYLQSQTIPVIEIDRPDRKARRAHGKSDPIDAIAAAQAVLSGRASGQPKSGSGPVEAIRVLRVTRASAVKARTAATNQLHALVTTAPEPLRDNIRNLRGTRLVRACHQLTANSTDPTTPAWATTTALRILAERIKHLSTQISDLDRQLKRLVSQAAPRTVALFGVGPDTAGQLLTTAGDNPNRLNNEAAFAHLTGAAPILASSGRTNRHRLNRGGDRAANRALYAIVLTRLARDPRTQRYVQRRTAEGLSNKEIIRCLKRYVAREVYTTLLADFAAMTP